MSQQPPPGQGYPPQQPQQGHPQQQPQQGYPQQQPQQQGYPQQQPQQQGYPQQQQPPPQQGYPQGYQQQQQPMGGGQAAQGQARAQARPPAGSAPRPGGGDGVLFQGIAKHTASFPKYLLWSGVCFLGGVLAWALLKLDFVVDAGLPVWVLVFAGTPGLLWTFLDHRSRKYKIDHRRVETERGVFTKKVDSLELWRVLDLEYNQSFIDKIFNNGRISLKGTDQSDPVLELHGLPQHRKLFELLRDAVQAARHTSRPMELVPGQEMDGAGGVGFQEFM